MTYYIAVTGHRPNKLGGYNPDNPIMHYVSAGLHADMFTLKDPWGDELTGITGMALGVDQLFAEICIDLSIPFIAAVPFIGQESVWPKASRDRYAWLLSQAQEVVVVCEGGYAAWKMQRRNEWMVDHCDELIAVWDGTPGGTANCIRYARQQFETVGKPSCLHVIDPRKA